MKYYIIAGEASGDLHASNLIKELKLIDKDSDFRCWGGDLMQEAGCELVKHYKDLAFMGFSEVLANLRTILNNIEFCKKDIKNYKPDVVILVDYPGFNLRIADYVKSLGIKVFYYISPQVWAWHKSRVKKIKLLVDKMFVILPFEKDFYKKYNYDVDFVGHPLLDAVEQKRETLPDVSVFKAANNLNEKPIIALLPGSRKQEVKKVLPIMLTIVDSYKDYQFVIAGAKSLPMDFYKQIIKDKNISIIKDKTYELLKNSDAAIVTSGTATLETALFEVPLVVCYKGSSISYHIAKRLVKDIKYISLVNLIIDKEIVKELIQNELNTNNLKIELDKILLNKEHRLNLIQQYKELKQILGGNGASKKTAKLITEYLK